MDEANFTASTESAAPADSGVSATTTSASSAGAGEQVASSPVQAEQTAQPTQTADDSIDIGWRYGDEETQEAALPEDDSDIEQLMGDPALDPARTPGLVEALRNARQQLREYAKQAKQQTAAPPAGSFTPQQLETVTRLFNPSPENGGIPSALDDLYNHARPIYAQMADNVIEADPDYALSKLQALGKIPAEIPQSSAAVDAEVLATIPQELQAIYQRQPAEARAELDLMTDNARNFFLNQQAQLEQLSNTQRQQAEAQWKQQVETARTSGQQAIQSLSEQFEKAHYAQLDKWSPFGPEDKSGNQQLYSSVVEGAFSELMQDQKFAQMYKDTHEMLSKAPERRLYNEGYAADADERTARANAAQFNVKLGQLIKARVEKLDSVFRDARAFREQQRQNAPNRTEFAGMSAQVNSGKGPAALDSKGKISEAYKQDLASRLNGRF